MTTKTFRCAYCFLSHAIDGEYCEDSPLKLHAPRKYHEPGDHDQESHGNWADGGGSYPAKTTNDPDYERYKGLPSKTVIAKSKRGHVETFIDVGPKGPQLRYRARLRSGELLRTTNSVLEAKRTIEAYGLENVSSGTLGAPLKWTDKK